MISHSRRGRGRGVPEVDYFLDGRNSDGIEATSAEFGRNTEFQSFGSSSGIPKFGSTSEVSEGTEYGRNTDKRVQK